MAANSVTGSFRGIDVSFAYKGPHIVMSVMNKAEQGRRLRVMFQQQPLSGRVNWVSFQLTQQAQDIVVPAEIIHSYKLAFYVDDHEPIATFTKKILEELKLIQENQPADDSTDEAISDSGKQHQQNIEPDQIEKEDANEKIETQSKTQTNDVVTSEETRSEPPSNDESSHQDLADSSNSAGKTPENSEVKQTSATKQAAYEPNTSIPNTVVQMPGLLNQKKHYLGKYIPNVSTELQFKIKVPSLPKSVSQNQATFIPPRPAIGSKSNGKKNGFFGQLAGTFGFTFSNRKKEYYTQRNRHLYEKFHADLEKLESDYNNGYGISLDNWDLESLNEEETAVLLLNLMVNEISAWKKVALKRESTKETLAKSLQNIEDELKHTLKQTRGMQAPSPTLFPDRTAMTDQDLMNIQEDCDSYLKRFSEKLATLEQQHAEKVRIPVFKKFLLEFIRDKLFFAVAKYSDLPSVQSRLNWFLDLVEYEIIPIEPGKTKVSSEYHDVKEKRNCDLESDTVAEVILPGLQTKDGKRVVQNAIVIQAE